MKDRTFIRKMLDIIFDNSFVKTVERIVNLYEENSFFPNKKLKNFSKMPLNNISSYNYNAKFVFNSENYKRNNLK